MSSRFGEQGLPFVGSRPARPGLIPPTAPAAGSSLPCRRYRDRRAARWRRPRAEPSTGTGRRGNYPENRRFRQRRVERRGEGMQVFWPAGVEKLQLRAATVAETLFGGADGAIVHLRLVAGNVFIPLDFQGLGEAEQENANPQDPAVLRKMEQEQRA